MPSAVFQNDNALDSYDFISSLFALAKLCYVDRLTVVIKEDNRLPYPIIANKPLLDSPETIGYLTGPSFFKELRHSGVVLNTTQKSYGHRLRTDWTNGKRFQARVSYLPSEVKERSAGIVGQAVFDSMRVFEEVRAV